jgi:hypothetical protein
VQGTARSELSAQLEACARLCEDAAELSSPRQPEVVSALLLAAAAMDTAVRALEEDAHARSTALMITATLARDAIDAAERHGLDEPLLRCVAALRRVVAACDGAA